MEPPEAWKTGQARGAKSTSKSATLVRKLPAVDGEHLPVVYESGDDDTEDGHWDGQEAAAPAILCSSRTNHRSYSEPEVMPAEVLSAPGTPTGLSSFNGVFMASYPTMYGAQAYHTVATAAAAAAYPYQVSSYSLHQPSHVTFTAPSEYLHGGQAFQPVHAAGAYAAGFAPQAQAQVLLHHQHHQYYSSEALRHQLEHYSRGAPTSAGGYVASAFHGHLPGPLDETSQYRHGSAAQAAAIAHSGDFLNSAGSPAGGWMMNSCAPSSQAHQQYRQHHQERRSKHRRAGEFEAHRQIHQQKAASNHPKHHPQRALSMQEHAMHWSRDATGRRARDRDGLVQGAVPFPTDHLNSASFDCGPVNARYFVMKVKTEYDVHQALKSNMYYSSKLLVKLGEEPSRQGGSHNRQSKASMQTTAANAANEEAAAAPAAAEGPVFLFFSVNCSGHFCGVAQITSFGAVTEHGGRLGHGHGHGGHGFDLEGQYGHGHGVGGGGLGPSALNVPITFRMQLEWKIVKDVPNTKLNHIQLPNNFNRAVTNSCDEQEVLEPEGLEVLKVMHEYPLITSVLDDYAFYESRLRGNNPNKLTAMSGKQRRVRAMRNMMEQQQELSRQEQVTGKQEMEEETQEKEEAQQLQLEQQQLEQQRLEQQQLELEQPVQTREGKQVPGQQDGEMEEGKSERAGGETKETTVDDSQKECTEAANDQ